MNILQMGGGEMANEQEESASRVSFDCKSRSNNLLPPPAELTNLVSVVDTVGKDLDLHQRLTSTVNQLVREIASLPASDLIR